MDMHIVQCLYTNNSDIMTDIILWHVRFHYVIINWNLTKFTRKWEAVIWFTVSTLQQQ